MGILSKVLHFIGGKPPKVNFKGLELFHDHTPKKWDDWKARFKAKDYKWDEHTGKVWKPTDKHTEKPKA